MGTNPRETVTFKHEPMLTTTHEKTNDVLILRMNGRLDAISCATFENEVLPLAGGSKTHVVIDAGALEYISSAGLRSLLLIARQQNAHGGKVIICSLNPGIKEVFRISGFDTIITPYPSVEAGMASLQA